MFKHQLFKLRPRLSGLLTAAGTVVAAATLIGFAGRLWWFCDLFANFRVQYLVSLSLVSFLLLLIRKFCAAAVFGLFAVANLALIVPYYLNAPNAPPPNAASPLRVTTINVNTANQRYDLVKQFVSENNPDFLLLIEVDGRWLKGVEEIELAYPHFVKRPRDDNFGIALYSKRPCRRCEIVSLGKAGLPSVIGEFEVAAGQTLTLLGTHPLPPKGRRYADERDDQLAAITEYLAKVRGAKMLAGDLNATPWSHHFCQLSRRAALSDGSRGLGLRLTWPASPFYLRIPIDHFLVSREVQVIRTSVGPHVGSDHFPLTVDFVLRQAD